MSANFLFQIHSKAGTHRVLNKSINFCEPIWLSKHWVISRSGGIFNSEIEKYLTLIFLNFIQLDVSFIYPTVGGGGQLLTICTHLNYHSTSIKSFSLWRKEPVRVAN